MKTPSARPRLSPDRYPPALQTPDELWHSVAGTVLVRVGGAIVAALGDWWVLGVLGAGPFEQVLMLLGARLVVMASFIVLFVPLTSCWVGCAGSLLMTVGLLFGPAGSSTVMLAPAIAMSVCYALVPLLHMLDKRRYTQAARGAVGFLLTETERRDRRAMATIEKTSAGRTIGTCLVIGLFCFWALTGFRAGRATPGNPLPFCCTLVMGLTIAGWWVRAASRRDRRRLFTQQTDVHLLEWQQSGKEVLLVQPGSTRPMAYLHDPKAVNRPLPRSRTNNGAEANPILPTPAQRQLVYVFGSLDPSHAIGLRDGAGRAWTANLSLHPDAAQLPPRADGRTLIAPELFWNLAPEAFEVYDPLLDSYLGVHAPGEPAPGRDPHALDGLLGQRAHDGRPQPAHSASGVPADLLRAGPAVLPASLRRPVTPPRQAARTADHAQPQTEQVAPVSTVQPTGPVATVQPAEPVPEPVAGPPSETMPPPAARPEPAPDRGDDWFTPMTTWTPSSEVLSPGTTWRSAIDWEPASSLTSDWEPTSGLTSGWEPASGLTGSQDGPWRPSTAWRPNSWQPGGGAAAGWTPPGLGAVGDDEETPHPSPGPAEPADGAPDADQQ